MIRIIQKNNETFQIGTLQDHHLMKSTASFPSYENAVEYLRRFSTNSYNMTVLRKVLYENSCRFDVHLFSDQDVISQIARKVARHQIFIARTTTAHSTGGSSFPSVNEVAQIEEKKWSKKEYVKSFLEESKSVDPPVAESVQETNWVAFKVVYDETNEPVVGVDLKLKRPDGTTNIYTTDGSGKIYLSGLPEGTCDIEEMLDNDALEVIEILNA